MPLLTMQHCLVPTAQEEEGGESGSPDESTHPRFTNTLEGPGVIWEEFKGAQSRGWKEAEKCCLGAALVMLPSFLSCHMCPALWHHHLDLLAS